VNRFFLIAVFVALLLGAWGVLSDSGSNTEKNYVPTAAKESSSDALEKSANKKLAYIVSDIRIPFWAIMARGVERSAETLGYEVDIYSVENSRKKELEYTAKAIRENVSGIIVSPTTSSACATILKLAKSANIPVVISDIGTDGGEYLSYISSNNRDGAYNIGKVLAKEMVKRGWHDGRVGIISIPQKRLNGQLRTAGFMQAMDEAGIKTADIRQQSTFSYEETYTYSKELIEKYPDLRALWLQGSDRYQGALDAIVDEGKKDQILLATFDAEPEFLELIPKGILVGSAMQQPYLMGREAVHAIDNHLRGKKIEKNLQLPILAISTENIKDKLPIIKQNVLGIEAKK
jgi:ribose transport system substrate-binding protein